METDGASPNKDRSLFVSKEAQDEFSELLNSFSQSLYLLNINRYILKQITYFPFHLCGIRNDDRLFFSIVEKNLVEYSIIVARRIFFDPTGWTLKQFRNKYCQFITEEHRRTVSQRIKGLQTNRIIKLEERVNKIRNSLAHSSSESERLHQLNFQDLDYLIEMINIFFDELSSLIGIHYNKVPFPYLEESPLIKHHHKNRNDIEQILDNVARASPLLELKEEDPEEWLELLLKWKESGQDKFNLNFLNVYRIEKGLDPLKALD